MCIVTWFGIQIYVQKWYRQKGPSDERKKIITNNTSYTQGSAFVSKDIRFLKRIIWKWIEEWEQHSSCKIDSQARFFLFCFVILVDWNDTAKFVCLNSTTFNWCKRTSKITNISSKFNFKISGSNLIQLINTEIRSCAIESSSIQLTTFHRATS